MVTEVVAPNLGSLARPGAEACDRAAPLVSVIIPHFNDLENLHACLALLKQQSLPSSQFEIVVADNNSACDLDAVRKACGGDVVVINAPIQGAAAARNAAVAASHGVNLAFIDSDCRPHPDWLKNGIAALESADMVGGQVVITALDEAHPTPVEAFEKVFAFNNKRYVEKESFSVTANMFVTRKVFDRVGAFRVGIAEDKDWGQRAARSGFRWAYAPDARLEHPARRDWNELSAKWRRLTREAYATARRKPFGHLYWLVRAWGILLSSLFDVFAISRSSAIKQTSGKSHAALILFRVRAWRFLESHRVLLSDLFGHG